MSDTTTEAPAPTGSETPSPEQLPADHPLVKTLAEQKKAIKELKAKAARLDEIEESQKSESQKAADRIAKAEAEVASVPAKVAESLRTHLVALHEIDAEKADLFLTATDPELLLRQVNGLVAESGKTKQRNNVVPREGNNPKPGEDPMREFARNLFVAE